MIYVRQNNNLFHHTTTTTTAITTITSTTTTTTTTTTTPHHYKPCGRQEEEDKNIPQLTLGSDLSSSRNAGHFMIYARRAAAPGDATLLYWMSPCLVPPALVSPPLWPILRNSLLSYYECFTMDKQVINRVL